VLPEIPGIGGKYPTLTPTVKDKGVEDGTQAEAKDKAEAEKRFTSVEWISPIHTGTSPKKNGPN